MRPRVLAVDDEPAVRRLLAVALALGGFEVATAGDGAEALALARRERFDLVLLDLNLPGMSGFELLERLRAEPRLRAIPVVMLTASGQDEDVVRGLRSGVASYMTKPFDPVALNRLLLRVVQRSVSDASTAATPDLGLVDALDPDEDAAHAPGEERGLRPDEE